MTITPSELAKLFEEIEALAKKAECEPPRRYVCDCGQIYYHPDLLHYCAQNNHFIGATH
jgi:hypothetical protein